jgi:hypothetical protein
MRVRTAEGCEHRFRPQVPLKPKTAERFATDQVNGGGIVKQYRGELDVETQSVSECKQNE